MFGIDDSIIEGRSLRLSDHTIDPIEGLQKLIYSLQEVGKDHVAVLIRCTLDLNRN
jgi:hypothetical protein